MTLGLQLLAGLAVAGLMLGWTAAAPAPVKIIARRKR
jgi:hypothetical protein